MGRYHGIHDPSLRFSRATISITNTVTFQGDKAHTRLKNIGCNPVVGVVALKDGPNKPTLFTTGNVKVKERSLYDVHPDAVVCRIRPISYYTKSSKVSGWNGYEIGLLFIPFWKGPFHD